MEKKYMFTIKLYKGGRQRILSAQNFTILRDDDGAEITLHMPDPNEDVRYDITTEDAPPGYSGPERFERAIIENSWGKTSEIIYANVPNGTLPLTGGR